MKRISLRRKTRFGSSKGVSTVIATVFLVLTVLVLSTNVFLWSFLQNAFYNQAVKERNQQDVDRLMENIIATNPTVVPSTGTINVTTYIINGGSIPAQIVTLWVLDVTPPQKYNVTDLRASNLTLNPGDRRTFSKTVRILGAISTDSFSAWFVTARGNTVSLTESQGIIIAQVSQGIGSVAMDFGSFVYYNVSGYNLQVWPNGKEGFYIPNRDIAFRVTLTNFDTNKRTIQLNPHSTLWMIFPTSATAHSAWWYIVNVNNGIITSKTKGSFSDISLFYSQPTIVYFASGYDLSTKDFTQSSPGYTGSAAVNLMLIGKIGASTLGQNIPFVSVYVT